MGLDEEQEDELRALVARLDTLVPREGAHLTLPADVEGRTPLGSRLGYLRLGVEILRAAAAPAPPSEAGPTRVEPDLGYLLTPGSRLPYTLCEVDESVGARPPARSRLGFLGQLVAGVLVLLAVVAAVVAGAWLVHVVLG